MRLSSRVLSTSSLPPPVSVPHCDSTSFSDVRVWEPRKVDFSVINSPGTSLSCGAEDMEWRRGRVELPLKHGIEVALAA